MRLLSSLEPAPSPSASPHRTGVLLRARAPPPPSPRRSHCDTSTTSASACGHGSVPEDGEDCNTDDDLPSRQPMMSEQQKNKPMSDAAAAAAPPGDDEQQRKARYRTTQINIVKINGVISAHATIKSEYLLTLQRRGQRTLPSVTLEDSVYNFHTKGSEQAAEIVRATDTIKKRLHYQLDPRGVPCNILNLDQIKKSWRDFKESMPDSDLFTALDESTTRQFIAAGDAEYNSEEILLRNSRTSLFSQVVFGQYLTRAPADFETEVFHTRSHFFPQIKFDVHCETTMQGEDEQTTRFEKTGRPLFVDKSAMIDLYDKMYKAQVEYRFTDYLYDFEMKFSVRKDEHTVDSAQVRINERIKNNIQSEVLYELRAVEL